MNIRSRLLFFLLPPLIAFVAFLSFFFYLNWYNQIIETYRSSLGTVVTNCSQIIDPNKHQWIDTHSDNLNIVDNEIFRRQQHMLYQIKKNLPITRLYTVRLKPVQKGELVLLNSPPSDINRAYDGSNSLYAYRRVYVIDASAPLPFEGAKLKYPGEYDYSDCGEHALYYTKTPMVSKVYKARLSGQTMISGFAPILDRSGHVTALVGADIAMNLIEPELHRALIIMIGAVAITILFVVGGVFFVAHKISKPVKKLTNSALALAAGEYGNKVKLRGPKEIVELANTLNTMSECLQEHLTRIKESSLLRERLYGEYECSVLLQHQMFSKVADDYDNPRIALRTITLSSATSLHGLRLSIEKSDARAVRLKLTEASEGGFDPMYALLTSPLEELSNIIVNIDKRYTHLDFVTQHMPRPIVWSIEQKGLLDVNSGEAALGKGDYLFLYNKGFELLFEDTAAVNAWFSKILQHFATEGIDSCTTIITNEINFLTQKQHIGHDINVLCIRITPAKSSPKS